MAEEREDYLSRKTGTVRKRRKDGWTKRDITTFLGHLRVTGNVAASAVAAGKSGRAAYNLRAVDAAFAAQWDAAQGEIDTRLEGKVALFAETGGKLPPLGEDGEPVEAPLENFDPHLAMAYLNYRRAKREGHGGGAPRPKCVSKDELVQALVRLFQMVQRRLAIRPAG
jgi:hypothetical protein